MDRDRSGSCPGEEHVSRLIAVLVAGVLSVSVTSLTGADGASASPAAVVPVATGDGTLSAWRPCSGMECARLTVPLDHDHPGAGTIQLAVTRIKADPGVDYDGVMLANPGGPGASGTWLPVLRDYVPNGAGAHYDWIGFDPRGVGASTPALRCDNRFFGTNRPSFVPRTHKLMRFWRKKTGRYAAACGASAARRLLPHLTTMDTVRDMEALRAALRAENPDVGPLLNFYGFSYGSYLGQVYATRYPDQVGKFVFDGVVDPTDYWYGANLRQEVEFDRNLKIFFKWIAAHPRAFHLGHSWRAIRHGYYRLLKSLDRHPAFHRKLGPDEVTDALLYAGYYVSEWDLLASAYSRLVRHRSGGPLLHYYASHNMGDDNGYAVYLGVQCTDTLRPPWRTQRRDAWRIHRKHPFLAWDNTWYNAPCLTWPAPSRTRLAVSGAAAAAHGGRFLLVNETRDAATPFSGALRVRSLFPSSRLIAGVGGTTHAGSLSGVGCVDDRIGAFLASGSLPARVSGTQADVRCPKVPAPSAWNYARIGGEQSAGGLPAALRARLVAAQRGSLG
jgi:pimeloyl-ACP methyl ester carboxylesterase